MYQILNIQTTGNFYSTLILTFKLLNVKIKSFIYSCLYLLIFTGCIKEITPSDAITPDILTSTDRRGLTQAVNGAYRCLKTMLYSMAPQMITTMYLGNIFK